MKDICFGVDLGGTTAKIGIFNDNGLLIDKWEISTRTEENGRYILEDIAASLNKAVVDKKLDKDRIVGIGLGVPGPVTEDGTVLQCVNLGWGEFNVENAMSRLTGYPVKAANDANVAALGEQWQGGGKGCRDLMMVTLGTGVGGGVIIGGKIISGNNGAAGEIGHMNVLAPEDTIGECGCGNHGCLEQIASATGLVRLAGKMLAECEEPSVLRGLKEVTAKDVLDAAKAEDLLSERIVDKMTYYLGKTLAGVSAVVNPEVIVVGGGVSKAGPYLIHRIQKHFLEYAFHAIRPTRFELAVLGNDAGMTGAARLALSQQAGMFRNVPEY